MVLAILTATLVGRFAGSSDSRKVASFNPAGPPPAAKYKTGDTASSAGFGVMVTAVLDPQPPGPLSAMPLPSEHFVTVDLQITNSTKAQQILSSLAAFHLLDRSNNEYERTILRGLTPSTPDGPIAAGHSLWGRVLFQVPNGATGLRLRFQGVATDPGVVFSLI